MAKGEYPLPRIAWGWPIGGKALEVHLNPKLMLLGLILYRPSVNDW